MFTLFSRLRPALAAAVIGLAVQAAPAAANTFNAGTLIEGVPYSQLSTNVGSFLDVFNFNLSAEADVSASIASLNLNLGALKIYNIDSLQIGLFNQAAPMTLLASGASSLNFDDLGAGQYFIRVLGEANGAFGGGYLFGLAASPAPEPEQWMLFAAGLLAVGSMVRRT